MVRENESPTNAILPMLTKKLSPRTMVRTIKVARTIADINGEENVGAAEIGEALQYSRYNVPIGDRCQEAY